MIGSARRRTKGRISRRTLFAYGAAGTALAAAATSAGRVALAASTPPPPPDLPTFELEEATIADLQRRMESGHESSRSLTEKYIARIDAMDRKGPSLHSVLEVNPDAASIAQSLDAERKAGKVRGPLHGIPILVKDNIGTSDRMTTTAGSLALE